MDAKYIICGVICIAAVSYSIGRFTGPTKVETKEVEKVVYVDRVVKDIDKDVQTTTKVTTKPDGTKVVETTREDKSKIHTDENKSGASEVTRETKTEDRPDWRLGAFYKPYMLNRNMEYGAVIERRVLGEVYAGVMVDNDRSVGFVVTVGF